VLGTARVLHGGLAAQWEPLRNFLGTKPFPDLPKAWKRALLTVEKGGKITFWLRGQKGTN